MSHGDIAARLRSALEEAYGSTGYWSYIIEVFGDDQSGDVIYSHQSKLQKASYTCSKNGATIDTANAVPVVPLTTYEPEGTAVTEAGRRNSARDMKQLQAIHDSSVGLGAMCAKAKESTSPVVDGPLKLVESASTLEPIRLREAKSDYEIKLIAPGKGSSAFYPREVLQRDGPKVFKAGTHVYLNHPTAAEEAARPEGDVANLAGVLTTAAVYHESHAKGEGLYARMKVFADHATTVEEKAPHVGMSIRAGGVAESGTKRDGLPVLKELTHAESVDVVTRAGAGGMILTEAAATMKCTMCKGDGECPKCDGTGNMKMAEAAVPPNPTTGGADVDAAELKQIKEALVLREANEKKLLERAIRGDAREFAVRTLKAITLHEAGKDLVIESVMSREIPQKDGAVDEVKFKEAIDAEAKRVGAVIAAATGSGQVRGMGAGTPVVPIDAKEAERKVAEHKKLRESAVRNFEEMGMSKVAAEASADRMLSEEVA